jgi:hypothetical protein
VHRFGADAARRLRQRHATASDVRPDRIDNLDVNAGLHTARLGLAAANDSVARTRAFQRTLIPCRNARGTTCDV